MAVSSAGTTAAWRQRWRPPTRTSSLWWGISWTSGQTRPEGAWREIVTPDSLVCENPVAREIEWTLRARIYRAEVINDDVPAEMRWDCRKRISDTGWSLEGRQAHNAFTNESVHVPTISTINPFWRKDYKFDETAAEFDPLITDDEMEEGGMERE